MNKNIDTGGDDDTIARQLRDFIVSNYGGALSMVNIKACYVLFPEIKRYMLKYCKNISSFCSKFHTLLEYKSTLYGKHIYYSH